jgi:hypothetical protein
VPQGELCLSTSRSWAAAFLDSRRRGRSAPADSMSAWWNESRSAAVSSVRMSSTASSSTRDLTRCSRTSPRPSRWSVSSDSRTGWWLHFRVGRPTWSATRGCGRCLKHQPWAIAAIERRLTANPGLFISAAGFRGVGLPDCIADAQKTAGQVLAFHRNRASEQPSVPVNVLTHTPDERDRQHRDVR